MIEYLKSVIFSALTVLLVVINLINGYSIDDRLKVI